MFFFNKRIKIEEPLINGGYPRTDNKKRKKDTRKKLYADA